MSFQFIDNNAALNPATRRAIRSHAAKGKNVGKTMKRRLKKDALSERGATLYITRNAIRNRDGPPDSEENMVLEPNIDRVIGDSLSTIFLPVHVSPKSRQLVIRGLSFFFGVRYIPEVSAAFDRGIRGPSMWIQLIFTDTAYFHIAMAMSIASVNRAAPVTRDEDWEMRHLSHTLCLVNQRLSSTDATCDATLAVVTMMAQYERHQGRHERGLLHMSGLYLLVNMRGGICNLLRENVVLAQKIVRLDLEYAVEMGSATMFRLDDIAHTRVSASSIRRAFDTEYGHEVSRFTLAKELSSELLGIATYMTRLSWLLNDALTGRRGRLHMMDGCMTMWEVGYRLLHFRPLSELSPENHIDNIVRLGLLMFMLPFLHKLDGTIPECPTIYKLARSAAEGHLKKIYGGIEHAVVLWMLLVGASSVFGRLDHIWMAPIMERLTQSLNIETWEEVTQVLAGFPWIDALFLTAGQSLFKAAIDVSSK